MYDELEIGSVIGKGSTGVVLQAIHKPTGTRLALKVSGVVAFLCQVPTTKLLVEKVKGRLPISRGDVGVLMGTGDQYV